MQHKIPNQALILFYFHFYFILTASEDNENEWKNVFFFIYHGDYLQSTSVNKQEDEICDQLVVPWNPIHFYIPTFPSDGVI